MAYSKIKICNMALANLGEASIRSFDEPNKRAKQCQVFYDLTQDYLLFRFDWGFARSFAKLQQLEDFDTPSGVYAFAKPPNCRALRDLYPRGSRQWWEILGDAVLTKIPGEVYFYYTASEVNPTKFSDAFAYLLASLLAVKLAPSISRSASMTKTLFDQYVREEADAFEADASQGNDYRPNDEKPDLDTFVHPELGVTDSFINTGAEENR